MNNRMRPTKSSFQAGSIVGAPSRAYFPAARQMSSVPVEVIISDPASYEEKRARIIADGGSNLQVGSLHSYVDQSHALTCATTRFFR